jgi:hypothetical protein
MMLKVWSDLVHYRILLLVPKLLVICQGAYSVLRNVILLGQVLRSCVFPRPFRICIKICIRSTVAISASLAKGLAEFSANSAHCQDHFD